MKFWVDVPASPESTGESRCISSTSSSETTMGGVIGKKLAPWTSFASTRERSAMENETMYTSIIVCNARTNIL